MKFWSMPFNVIGTNNKTLTVNLPNAHHNDWICAHVQIVRLVESAAGAGATAYIKEYVKGGKLTPVTGEQYSLTDTGITEITIGLEVWNCDATALLVAQA